MHGLSIDETKRIYHPAQFYRISHGSFRKLINFLKKKTTTPQQPKSLILS